MDHQTQPSPRQRAISAQRDASDPCVSAFVSASAGSGKTKLLTDRLLRLMLAGADPARIQCLTFTKAAAAEMAVRLHKRLGAWVTIAPGPLDAELASLDVELSDANRAKARALFATILDLPGGMRIETIHAFCQSLLRRFPIEAALSPHFQLVETAEAGEALDEAREAVLAAGAPGLGATLACLAGLASAEGFGQLVTILAAEADRMQAVFDLGPDRRDAAIARLVGATRDDAAALADAADWPGRADLATALGAAAREGSPGVVKTAGRMLDWLAQPPARRQATWPDWLGLLLTGDGKPRAPGAFCNDKIKGRFPEIGTQVDAEQSRVLLIEAERRAIEVARVSAALLRLAAPVLAGWQARKAVGGLLDYDDLIARTSRLLIDPGAAWVLYKLDGGLDHLLLDEVQDTSDPQWRIADALTAEFFAGRGTREPGIGPDAPARTFFAVGDPKQSIYSFQGADPEAFERWRTHLRGRAEGAAQDWRQVPLDVSFRSTAPVLALVDAVFAEPRAGHGVVDGAPLHHYPDRAGQAGCVTLWPLMPRPEEAKPEPWTVPLENQTASSAPQRLADALACWIAGQTDGTVMLHSAGRPVVAGDILILVRRRGAFDRALVRALKGRGVPVAGLDRMVLTEQPAVQDLLALLDVLLLPEDDLTLACLLVSPLGGLSDDSLMRLAMGRDRQSLWDRLRDRRAEQPDWAAAAAMIGRLLARVDYTTSHALLAEALGPLGGRARLFARLGPDAAEPVDELLAAALRHAATHPPGLQGFLHWLRRSGAEIKREADPGGDTRGPGEVRIMTVHGAKGLQAPIVILPDTTALPPDDDPFVWLHDAVEDLPLPIWTPRKELRCPAVDAARQAARQRHIAEYNRLLYVALTRAEDRLLICGWQSKTDDPACWYRLVEAGMAQLPTEPGPLPAEPVVDGWGGPALHHRVPQTVPPVVRPAATPGTAPPPPVWAGQAPAWCPAAPPPEPTRPQPLAPSRPDGIAFGPVPATASPLGAAGRDGLAQGRIVHSLLQHLPGLPPEAWDRAAHDYTASRAAPAEAARLAVECLAVLRHPDLAPLFGPDSMAEVPLTGQVNGMVVTGVVDRLAIRPDSVWIADYKTGRDPPTTVEAVPVHYLRQLAAYRAVLLGIAPDRPVRTCLIWTRGAIAMPIPPALLDRHAPGAVEAPEAAA